MNHISHHLNPGSLKTKHAADYSALGTPNERSQHTVKGADGLLPESIKPGVELLKYQRDTEITENTQGG